MRTTGPAKTIRLLTKGGSLPGGSRQAREEISATTAEERDPFGGSPEPAKRKEFCTRVDSASSETGISRSPRNNNVSLFLKNAIVELLSKSTAPNGSESQTLESIPPLSERLKASETPIARKNSRDTLSERGASETAFAQFPHWKRALDLTCIFLSLPLWLPLTVLAMLWIKVASSGPIFYRQERVGYRGNRFMIFKFRSMKVNVETKIHEHHLEHLIRADRPMTKLDASGDPRLIPGGLIFRAAGLDELPQIFNVLRGEMSLVGPRPCTRHEFDRYQTWQRQRIAAPPGLTGLWQVNGKNKTTFSEMVTMDIFYAKNMSLWLDLKILLKTIPAVADQVLEARSLRRREGGKSAFHGGTSRAESFADSATKS